MFSHHTLSNMRCLANVESLCLQTFKVVLVRASSTVAKQCKQKTTLGRKGLISAELKAGSWRQALKQSI